MIVGGGPVGTTRAAGSPEDCRAGSFRLDNAETIRQHDEGERRWRLTGSPEEKRAVSNSQICGRGAYEMKVGVAAARISRQPWRPDHHQHVMTIDASRASAPPLTSGFPV